MRSLKAGQRKETTCQQGGTHENGTGPRVIIPATFPRAMTEPITHPPRLLRWVAGFARWALGLLLTLWLLLTLA